MLRSSRLPFTGVALCIAFVVFSLWRLRLQDHIPYFTANANVTRENPAKGFKADLGRVRDVHNTTLGFEKVFTVNLAARPDKLDLFALVSSLTGFKVDVIAGVNGHDVPNKSLPALDGLPKDERVRDNTVGCWRAHLNFARTIIDQGLSTALVMEDDADWDTGLKNQLDLFAQGSQFVTGLEPGQTPHSPYGDDWDLLWLGHCGNTIIQDDERRFVIENDATVPAGNRRTNFADFPDMAREGYDNETRVIYRARRGCCLYAYALSYRGAQKLLRHEASTTKWRPIDVAVSDWCATDPNVKCIGVFPQLIDSHKFAGRQNRNSDIAEYSAQEVRNKGYTFNIVHSTRLNLDHLLAEESDKIERQWPDDPEVIGAPRGRPMGRVVENTA